MADQIVFNDAIPLLGVGAGVTTLTGSPVITYGPTNTVTGSLSLTAAGALGAQTYTNLAVTQTGTDPTSGQPIYTLTGSNALTSVSIGYTGVLPTTANVTIDAAGTPISNATAVSVSSSVAPCFVAGTLIRTPNGDIAIERLRVGDLVTTAGGDERPIRWLSHRVVSCHRYADQNFILPVCIQADAFGPNRPARDLFVSPGHSICVEVLSEVLIPASSLVNGSTIRQVEVEEVSYWHIELDRHDIVLAENLPAESYLEMSNREFFSGAGVTMLDSVPDALTAGAVPTHADFCRPFHQFGEVVDAVRQQLQLRAAEQGWTRKHEIFGDLHLMIDGRRIQPVTRGLVARFEIPAETRDIWLVSTTSQPRMVSAALDSRNLGVFISNLRIEDGFESREIALDDPRLCVGFHPMEDHRRWTAGRALLPASLWRGRAESFFLRVELFCPALATLVAPEPAVPANTKRIRLVAAA